MSKKDPTIRAAIYCRISQDSAGEGLGVERQEQDCRALAESLGWEVSAVYVDNDISASTRSSKHRPQYAEMLRLARLGHFGAILAYSNSRLTRRPAEWLTLIDLANTGKIRIKTVASGEHDLSTADGRAVALTVAAWDAAEAERTAERVSRSKKQAAESGRYRGGPRPFGYESGGMVIREDEAAIIRECTTAALAGRSLRALSRELNERGVLTSTGNTWEFSRLRDVLIRPRNAGLLHTGRPDRGGIDFVIVGKALWPAIVDEEEWRAIHNLLLDPSRNRNDGKGTRWLGSGIYLCGRCGSGMRAGPVGGTPSRKHEQLWDYRCKESAHLTIRADHTDAHILATVAEMVRHTRFVESMTASQGDAMQADRERRSLLLTRISQVEKDYDDDLIDAKRYRVKVDKLEAELTEIEERLAEAVQASTVSPIFNAADPGKAFLEAPVDVQRAVLRSVLSVVVEPSPYRGATWTATRLSLVPLVA